MRQDTIRKKRGKKVAALFKFGVPRTLYYGGDGMPDEFYTTLKYNDTVQITGAGVSIHTYQSSLYDPDLTGSGHQPMYRDQFAEFYGKYQVLGITAHLSFSNTQGSIGLNVYAFWSDAPPSSPSINDIAEQPYSWNRAISSVNGNGHVEYRSTMMAEQINGVPYVLDDVTQQASSGASPSDLFYLTFTANDLLSAGTWVAVVEVKLMYHVRFFERLIVGTS